ncbi:hypothetical protein BY458DRAFT_528933 [Sporodiniella umbellata]|nr:hypothetical protein BY458DRAFT_528933 [Sporodiniella umbellata]
MMIFCIMFLWVFLVFRCFCVFLNPAAVCVFEPFGVFEPFVPYMAVGVIVAKNNKNSMAL